MEIDKEEMRRRREHAKAAADEQRVRERLAALTRATRSAKSRLLATTRSENWHRQSLAWLDRDAGYDGEMASARAWLRSLPLSRYVEQLEPYARKMPDATNIAVEVAAVRANLDQWTENGEALLLNRAKHEYAEDLAGFREWQRANPGNDAWRKKPATRAQRFLVARTATARGIEPPGRMNRGEAHDWLAAHGGNLRLGGDTEPALDDPAPNASPPNSGSVATVSPSTSRQRNTEDDLFVGSKEVQS